ncbi:hypothetical protein [Pareuzebyella sediminis]|uniref:hypothetical protein n=1 Tax=Pareuzebyella sediminis TaxID=2607998 RepID=UPI0011EDC2F9|nr:hypothetical protein [Pareuzebyella sediminis]
MKTSDIYLGNSKLTFDQKEIGGQLVRFENEDYYRISNYDGMRPFFMSIISHSNHWMFISSNGGLTAGRKNSDFPLFPYYTDDKITESSHVTGSKTMMQIRSGNRTFIWEPFSKEYAGIYNIHRNLYKNRYGNKVVFEEVNEDLGLVYRYHWNSSDQYGFVRKSTLINTRQKEVHIKILDGIQNIMPYGVHSDLQNAYSNLVDAYKKNELEADIGLGIYSLSAIIVDRAEPSEALKATTVWSVGIENGRYLISSLQLDAFRKGNPITQEVAVRAEKGAYFVSTDILLRAEAEKSWLIIADVDQSMVDISKISEKKKNGENLIESVLADIEMGSKQLITLSGAADSLQVTTDKLRDTRHFANTLFNIMRGGIFDHHYQIEKTDFIKYIRGANIELYTQKKEVLEHLPEHFALQYLRRLSDQQEDTDFKRLAFEYMPLKFSRRHGDPSRPWNKFSINIKAEDGTKVLDYQGNWRDIFQNWEALAHSYPAFIESMIYKFLNASTFDGYNPYRVTKDGFDWETIEPDDTWSYIGYWGDHQIIYLLKFLEFIERYFPQKLGSYFNRKIFVYANVPYKIKSYPEILKNPKDTLIFDKKLDSEINQERLKIGADGALLKHGAKAVCKANLIEKLLVPVLVKLSNFIPEGGIWMNTQRPEWNDANNALVGNGVSMVTLYYLRRFLNFLKKIVHNTPDENYEVSEELHTFFTRVTATLIKNFTILSGKISDTDRKSVLDGLGNAGSAYRNTIYKNGFSNTNKRISKTDLLQFIEISLKYLDHSIEANKRVDKLYHAYNLMSIENDTEISITYLPEMLEGQVGVLSSGYLSGEASLELLNALKNSKLFRPDQYSYILYPNKELPRFCDKNNIPCEYINKSKLLQKLLEDGNVQIVERDLKGNYHFNGTFNNADSVKRALDQLSEERYGDLIKKDKEHLLNTFEEVFDHKSFTGRSGTFFGYEGLGSIYWHMVSKLLLSVQETCLLALKKNENEMVTEGLVHHYYEINAGIGVHKSPELYGAFPTDPYSHTPAGKGAQQPGMTGQVKEDILSRFGELGVVVTDGKLEFNPCLLRKEEFLKTPTTFEYIAIDNKTKNLYLSKDSLCFTYCQVPIIYELATKEGIKVFFDNAPTLEFEGLTLDNRISEKIFKRSGAIDKIFVSLKIRQGLA